MQNVADNPAKNLEALGEFARRDQLEPPETYRVALAAVIDVLSSQGSLVYLQDVPTIVIPDLHARREMLIAILSTQLAEGPFSGMQIFELLRQGHINVVCVGDIVHSEDRTHWVINLDGEWTPDLLDKEMVRSLGMGAMIMYLKLQYPEHFYCLRGNHDDIDMEFGPFRKFVGLKYDEQDNAVEVEGHPVFTGEKGESKIVKDWVLAREGWGQAFLDAWAQFERSLPLFAQGSYYVISHTLPLVPLSAEALRDSDRAQEVVKELISSRGINEAAIDGTLENLSVKDKVQRWFHGHTPVPSEYNDGKYKEDLDGLLIRLNNPKKHIFAYVPSSNDERRFHPDRDVYLLEQVNKRDNLTC